MDFIEDKLLRLATYVAEWGISEDDDALVEDINRLIGGLYDRDKVELRNGAELLVRWLEEGGVCNDHS